MIFSLNNKKGMALVLVYSLLVIIVGILGIFFYISIQSIKVSQQRVDFTRAFYAAESGIDAGLQELKDPDFILPYNDTGNLAGAASYQVWVDYDDPLESDTVFNITSIGYAPHSSASPRTEVELEVIAEATSQSSPNNFGYAIETQGDLNIDGAAKKNIDEEETNKYSENVVFEDLFGMTKDEMRAIAVKTYVIDDDFEPDFRGEVSNITWIDIEPGVVFKIAGQQQWSGIVIINGDFNQGEVDGVDYGGGNLEFEGILYIIGSLNIAGTITTEGTVLVECGADIDSGIEGNATVTYDEDAINAALLSLSKIEVISWRETGRRIQAEN